MENVLQNTIVCSVSKKNCSNYKNMLYWNCCRILSGSSSFLYKYKVRESREARTGRMKTIMIENLFDGKKICFCGREHSTKIKELHTGAGCIEKLPDFIGKRNVRKILLLCRREDSDTGRKIQKLLKNSRVILQKLYVDCREIESEEQFAGWVMFRTDVHTEMALVIGKGEFINISRYLCDRLRIPTVVIFTGISEISSCASWIPVHEEGVPHFYKISEPEAVYIDSGLMTNITGEELFTAFLDILGAQIALYEWRLSHLITGEHYCTYLEQEFLKLIKASEKILKYLENKEESSNCCSEAAGIVVQIQTGVSLLITYADSPRLTEGSYWMLREFWERRKNLFRRMEESEARNLSLETAYNICARVSSMVGDRWKVFEERNQEKWENRIEALYGKQSDYIRKLEIKTGKNSREKVFLRRKRIEEKYREIQKIDYLLINKENVQRIKRIKSIFKKQNRHFSAEEFYDGLIYAKDMLNSYVSFDLLYDLGKLEKTAGQLKKYFNF